MAIGRDWLRTLFPASFKGVPFQTERDEEEGGRRIVSHEFPGRDDPFNEDLGEAKRDFDVTAYLASDTVDVQATALTSVCAQRGAGILVLPTHGPITVRCLNFRRSREKDRAGRIAYTLRFVREGAATSLVSFASLANMVFARADALASAVSVFAETAIYALGQPDFVIEAATEGLQTGAATLDVVRMSGNIDPASSAVQRNAIKTLYDAAPEAASQTSGVNGEAFADLVTIARGIADGMEGGAAVRAFEPILGDQLDPPAGPFRTPAAKAAADNEFATALMMRMAALAAYAEGIASAVISDRQTAIALRADAAEYFDAVLYALSAYEPEIYRAVVDLSGATIDYLSRAILDRAPVIPVEANRRMPSLWWAHRLYRDPTRSTELAERNRVAHPSFMPTDFEALAR